MASNLWTADRRLYLDKDGRAVEENDPTRATLLVPAGGTLLLERARALGLVSEASEAASPAAAANPEKRTPANKAKRPAETKDGTNTPRSSEEA